MTRNRIRRPKVGAVPQKSELKVKRKIQSRKKRLRPNRLANQPLIGSTMAFETKYDVSTKVLSSLLAPRFPAMCGNATLAMLVSSTSMNAASATTTAMSQGLCFGRQGSRGGAAGGVASTSVLLDIDFGNNGHARPQPMVVVLFRIDIDADRNALHHLHVVSRGVLWGQQTEARTARTTAAGPLAVV